MLLPTGYVILAVNMENLKGKTALVTGASRGIGGAIAQRFVDEGANVIMPSRNEMDLADVASVAQYVQAHANVPLDILVNNAAINPMTPLDEITPELLKAFEEVMTVNLESPFLLSIGFAPGMIERGGGSIINIASLWGILGRGNRALYSMSKHGLIGMTESLAQLLGPQKIRVNAVSPGFVGTDMTYQNLRPNQIEDIKQGTPLGELVPVGHIANAVLWLASAESGYITGQNIVVDGGWSNVGRIAPPK